MGSEKKAHGCSTPVSQIAATSEAANTTTSVTPMRCTPRATWPRAKATPATSASSAGQKT